MKNFYTILLVLITISGLSYLVGKSFRVANIPHGAENSCANCHVNPNGGGARNAFGIVAEGLVVVNENFWSPEVAALDSDGDGFTNGQELQDPDGTWIKGTTLPGDPSLVTNPGDPNDFPAVTSLDEFTDIPNNFELGNNYPNPFNPSTNISFSIANSSNVVLEIYNSLGEKVKTLVNQNYSAGTYSTVWNAKDDFGNKVNSGIYIYRLVSDNFVDTKRMVLLK